MIYFKYRNFVRLPQRDDCFFDLSGGWDQCLKSREAGLPSQGIEEKCGVTTDVRTAGEVRNISVKFRSYFIVIAGTEVDVVSEGIAFLANHKRNFSMCF